MTHLSFQSGYIPLSKYRNLKITDSTIDLMVYMSGSTGGGRSATSSPCTTSAGGVFRYSKNGCGRLGYGGALTCAGVSINHIHFVNLIQF